MQTKDINSKFKGSFSQDDSYREPLEQIEGESDDDFEMWKDVEEELSRGEKVMEKKGKVKEGFEHENLVYDDVMDDWDSEEDISGPNDFNFLEPNEDDLFVIEAEKMYQLGQKIADRYSDKIMSIAHDFIQAPGDDNPELEDEIFEGVEQISTELANSFIEGFNTAWFYPLGRSD